MFLFINLQAGLELRFTSEAKGRGEYIKIISVIEPNQFTSVNKRHASKTVQSSICLVASKNQPETNKIVDLLVYFRYRIESYFSVYFS